MLFGKKKDKALNQGDDRIKVDTSTITTMVGVDTVVEGLLKTKSSIRINGTVIGDVRADGVVVLTKTGHIVGTIEAANIIVAGVVEGNMSIRDKVNVEASGEIYGDVITKKFVIDEESIFQGNCIMNRDGKIIPVPPYKKDSDKEEKEDKKEDKKIEKDKADSDKENKKDSDTEKSDKADSKDTDKDNKKDLVSDKKADDKDDKDGVKEESDNEKKDKDDSEKENDDSVASDDKSEEDKDNDNELIIADINDVEAPEDIPASGEKKNNNYVKKSKSLSVEIENE